MPKLILTADQPSSSPPVLLTETVQAVHLHSDHAASQLIERLRWALADAEALERPGAQPHARRGSARSRPTPAHVSV